MLLLIAIIGGGLIGVIALAAAPLLFALLTTPELGLACTIISSVLWIIGAWRPSGINFLGPAQVFMILTLVSGFFWALHRRILPTSAPHMKPLICFALVVAASPLLTPAPIKDSIIGIQKHLMVFMLYFLVANLAISRATIQRQLVILVAAFAISSVIAIVEFIMPGVEFEMGEVTLGARIDPSVDGGSIKRVTGGLGDANWYSYSMVTGLPIAWYFFRIGQSPLLRTCALLVVGLMLAGTVLSYTRTALFGIVAAGAYLLWRGKLPLAPLAFATALVIISSPIWLPKSFVDRVFSVKYMAQGSTPMRKEIVTTAAQLFLEQPVLGYGYQQFGRLFVSRTQSEFGLNTAELDRSGDQPAEFLRAHNLYLDVAVAYGLAGLLPLLLFYGGLLRELGQIRTNGNAADEELATALIASFIAFFVCGMGGHSADLKTFWILAGFAAGLRRVWIEDYVSEDDTTVNME